MVNNSLHPLMPTIQKLARIFSVGRFPRPNKLSMHQPAYFLLLHQTLKAGLALASADQNQFHESLAAFPLADLPFKGEPEA